MGLIRGEGRILRQKYQKKYGLTQSEAITEVGKFIDEINLIKKQMKAKKKSEAEIKLKTQQRFEEEFMKLCCED